MGKCKICGKEEFFIDAELCEGCYKDLNED
jgi:hypothetical protein